MTEKLRLIEDLVPLKKGRDWAEKCLTPGQVPQTIIGPKGNETLIPAYDDWMSLTTQGGNFRPEHVTTLLDPETKEWKYQINLEELENRLDIKPEEFVQYLVPIFEPLYRPVQPRLDKYSAGQFGFNNHELHKHILKVAESVAFLYRTAGVTENKTINLALVGVLLHDIGNAFDRKLHHYLIVALFKMMTGVGIDQKTIFETPLLAALCHDESVGFGIIKALYDRVKTELSKDGRKPTSKEISEQFFKEYQVIAPHSTMFLQMGDKAHISKERTENTIPKNTKALEDDMHFFLNALCPDASMHLEEDTFVLKMPFSLHTNTPEMAVPRRSQEGYKYIPPKQMITNLIEQSNGTWHSIFKQWVHELWNTYDNRLKLFVVNAFAAFPHLKNVRFEFKDISLSRFGTGTSQEEARMIFDRNSFFYDFNEHSTQFKGSAVAPKDEKKKKKIVSHMFGIEDLALGTHRQLVTV